MTFLEAIDMTLARVDEESSTSVDPVGLSVVKNAINQAYMLLSANVDRRTAEQSSAFSSKITLPTDLIMLTNVAHSVKGNLSAVDYEVKANLLYVKSADISTGNIIITYVKFPARLVNNTDTIQLADGYAYALSAYAGYVYQLYRRKYSAAQLLLAEYNSFLELGRLKDENQGYLQAGA